jgi:phosphatidylinositol glycan class T
MEGGTPRRIGWKELEWSDLRIDDDDDNDGSEVRTIRWSFRHVLPPSTALEVAVDYEPAFLNFERFPADPNRGFELPPFVARFSSTGGCGGCPDGADPAARCPGASATLHSGSPLLLAPVPDMSMPFNVVSLGCTLYAFVIGSLIHLVVRRGSERVKHALNPEERPASPAQRVKAAVLGRWRALAVAGWAPRRRRPARGLATPAQAEGSAQDATPADDGT